MGVTALLLRDSVSYTVQSATPNGRGGSTVTFGSAVTLRARINVGAPAPDVLAQQLAGRNFAQIIVDDRAVTGGVQEGGRFTTRDGRTWDIRHVAKTHLDLALSSASNEVAFCDCTETV